MNTARSKMVLALAILISLAVVAYVLYRTDVRVIGSTLQTAQPGWLVLAFAAYILNYILRAWRLEALIPRTGMPFSQLVALNGLYGMYNYLLPGKTGEVSYVVLVNRRMRATLAMSAASLIVQRYLDFVVIAAFLVVVLVLYAGSLPAWLVYGCVGFCLLVVAAGAALQWLLARRSTMGQEAGSLSPHWLRRTWQVLLDLRDGMAEIKARHEQLRLLLLTAGIWLCINTSFFLIVFSLGFHLQYFQVVVISVIMIPLTLLPFQGFANLGTHELGWVVAFSIFGMPQATALQVAFSSHIILVVFVLLLGAVSAVTMLLFEPAALRGRAGGPPHSGAA